MTLIFYRNIHTFYSIILNISLYIYYAKKHLNNTPTILFTFAFDEKKWVALFIDGWSRDSNIKGWIWFVCYDLLVNVKIAQKCIKISINLLKGIILAGVRMQSIFDISFLLAKCLHKSDRFCFWLKISGYSIFDFLYEIFLSRKK